jgi:DNA polymerase III psi subunit
MEITKEQVLNDDKLLDKVLKSYNATKKATFIYRQKNKEKLNENSRLYYYINTDKEPKIENKTADMKKYMKEYRQKQKELKNKN